MVARVGIAAAFSAFLASQETKRGAPANILMFSIAASMASPAVAALGTFVITGQYSTGMIRLTLAAVPRRLQALWAKNLVLAVSIFLVSTVGVALSLAVMRLFLGAKGLAPDLGNSETLRILLGAGGAPHGHRLLAFASGALLRHSAGALATALGLLLVIENLAQIPWRPPQLVSPLLPGTAGSKILMT